MFQKNVDTNHSIAFKKVKKEIKIEVKRSVKKHVNRRTNAFGFSIFNFFALKKNDVE
jgi:hypothetical protein